MGQVIFVAATLVYVTYGCTRQVTMFAYMALASSFVLRKMCEIYRCIDYDIDSKVLSMCRNNNLCIHCRIPIFCISIALFTVH